MSALEEVVRAADPELRAHAVPEPSGARYGASGEPGAFVLEAVREGYEMHYGAPRAFSAELDPDTRLLAGDSLYALGLAHLAERGELEAIAELADLITGCARARVEGRPELTEQMWRASAGRLAGQGTPGAARLLAEGLARSG